MAIPALSNDVSHGTQQGTSVSDMPETSGIAQQLALQVSEQLPSVLQQLRDHGFDPDNQALQLECSLTAGNTRDSMTSNRVQVTAVNIGRKPSAPATTTQTNYFAQSSASALPLVDHARDHLSSWNARTDTTSLEDNERPTKQRRIDFEAPGRSSEASIDNSEFENASTSPTRKDLGQRQRRVPDNPALQPSTFDKFVNGIWESIFSGVHMDPAEVIQQWQAIESSGQPKLLRDVEHRVTYHKDTNAFGRINVLTRKISQTSKTCRSLEVIVQAHWVHCFENRVAELTRDLSSPEKAKKAAIAEACVDFKWTEKDLRNKMAIWRGYHEIKCTAGWAALVFAGMGLYRFCKYRVSFTDEAFDTLRRLRHRLEVAADTLHPRWRVLLGIVGESTEPKYRGHPHDWVVNGPNNDAIPLAQTYHQWGSGFEYTHLEMSVVDKDNWGNFDPRVTISDTDMATYKCQVCGEVQSDDPVHNACACYPNLYGSPKATMAPVQIFRTPNGKNNGLIACCPFEKGWAVGEFVGLITSGLAGLDVMVGQTDKAAPYQIWQGRQGNHTRFVNHSCRPNSHFERFVWLGKQRIVLASEGIEAGEEITVDYGHTYWEVSSAKSRLI